MPFPNFEGKHDAPSVFTPVDLLDGVEETLPPALVVCYQDAFFEEVVAEYAEETIDVAGTIGEVYRVTDDVAVVGDFGIGGPVTAGLVEEKAELGVEKICILGGAGCLDPSITPDRPVVATRAIRDEGASYHYLPPEATAEPSPTLVDALTVELGAAGQQVATGPTWTTDAFFRETVPEVERYAEQGVLSVEMEAATLFAVAEYVGVDAAAVFAIGDYVTADDRTVPEASHALLPELFEPVVETLAASVRDGD